MKKRLLAAVLLGAALSAPPLLAKPADPIAAAVADPARGAKNRELDASRMPAEVLAFTGIKPGMVVADYFAGGGYYTELFSRAVGPKGMVYALDPDVFFDAKGWEPILASHSNVRTLVAPVAGLQLAPGSVDILFTNLNYHDLYWESEKYKYVRVDVPAVLAGWFRAVKPGGSVVIIDHAGPAGDPREVADRLHRIDPERVKADMLAAGFVLDGESQILRRTDDDHSKNVFDPAVRGKTDRFVLRFRRP